MFVAPDTSIFTVHPGDTLVLCSDGLHDEMSEATIAEIERKAKDCEDRAKSDPSRADALLREAASLREWIASLKRGHWRS